MLKIRVYAVHKYTTIHLFRKNKESESANPNKKQHIVMGVIWCATMLRALDECTL